MWEAIYRGILEGIVLAAGCLSPREIQQIAEDASRFGEMDNACRSPYDVRVRAIIAQQQVFVRHAPAIVRRLDRLRGPL